MKRRDLQHGWATYECERRRNRHSCRAGLRVHMQNEAAIPLGEHTHAPEDGKIEAAKSVQGMKARAQTTAETPQHILTNHLQGLTQGAAGHLPNLPDMRRNIRRQRQRSGNPLPVPQSKEDIPNPLPPHYRETADGRNFLLVDTNDDDRILIFGTEEGVAMLGNYENWFMDGTFKTVPPLYLQLYTIHSLVDGRTIPAVYALLPDKRRTTYERLLTSLVALNANLAPATVMTDFELGAQSAVKDVFPDAQAKGCFFHFAQAVYRKVQSEGLQQRYQEDPNFAMQCRMLAALAFVPVGDTQAAFDELGAELPDVLQPVVDYVEDTFLGPVRRGIRRAPRYTAAVWSVYDRVNQDLPRTNNSVEGWNSSLSANIGAHHMNFWKFIEVLKREEALATVQRAHALQGRDPPAPRPVYAALHARIVNIVGDYAETPLLQYLQRCAMNFTW